MCFLRRRSKRYKPPYHERVDPTRLVSLKKKLLVFLNYLLSCKRHIWFQRVPLCIDGLWAFFCKNHRFLFHYSTDKRNRSLSASRDMYQRKEKPYIGTVEEGLLFISALAIRNLEKFYGPKKKPLWRNQQPLNMREPRSSIAQHSCG